VSRIDPVAPADAVRARVPAALAAHAETRATVLEDGLVERSLKELCARYLAEDDDVVMHADDPALHTERERAALAWADAIAWDSDRAGAELWARLHAHFSEPELVELGYAIAFMLGQQHWLATLGLTEDARWSAPPEAPG
jgi:alkylhydroperoxidase family enzyme